MAGRRVIAILSHQAPLSAKDLTALTALDQVSISRALERLVNKGLVSRKEDGLARDGPDSPS